MFTGIIEKLGRVVSLIRTAEGAKLSLDIGELAEQVNSGGSVAVNGVCLTAVAISGYVVEFDVVSETLSRTNIGQLKTGEYVNIELPLKFSGRIEGHFVLGHIDTTARIIAISQSGIGKRMSFRLDDVSYMQYVIPKGSIAIDGISLTIADVSDSDFTIALIPMTLSATTLGQKQIGAKVNIETDILVKSVIHHQTKTNFSSDEHLASLLKQSGFTDNV